MTSATVKVSDLHKRFGATMALNGMTFEVDPGQVIGFAGPNGAGKSTTLRVVLGLTRPDQGKALIGGRPYATLRHPLRRDGALLDPNAFEPDRTGRNHLLWIAHSQGLGARRVDEVLDLVGLRAAATRAAGGYSLGMRQRLGVAAALLGDPVVVLMDEPFNGLDPEGIAWMRALLRALAGEGRTVLVSTHLMPEMEDIARHLVVVGRGRVLADTTDEALIASQPVQRVIVRTPEVARAAAALTQGGAVAGVYGSERLAVTGMSGEEVASLLARRGQAFSELAVEHATLEDTFMQLTAETADYRAARRGEVRP